MRNRSFIFFVTTGALLVWGLLGCSGEGDAEQVEPVQAIPGKTEVRLNEEEKDTLRAMVKRFGITREEYWEGVGGVLASEEDCAQLRVCTQPR